MVKRLIFVEHPNPGKKTKRWLIVNQTGEQLGYIEFRPGWRKYIWGMFAGVVFDVDCTKEVSDFLTEHAGDRNQ